MYTWKPKYLKKWTKSDNYIGDDYSDHYIFLACTRDSDLLTKSNYNVALEKIKEIDPSFDDCYFSHWGCGYFNLILIDNSNEKVLKLCDNLAQSLNEYACLDESDYSELCNESLNNDIALYKDQACNNICKFLEIEEEGIDNTEMDNAIALLFEGCAAYYGYDDAYPYDLSNTFTYLQSICEENNNNKYLVALINK